MATTKKNKERGKRIRVFFGKQTVKVKGKNNTYNALIRCFDDTIQLFNLPVATQAQIETEGGRELFGSKGTKSITLEHPTGSKTKAGNVKLYQIPVPGSAKVKDIREFLAKTKAKYFKVDGGWYNVQPGGR